MSAAPTPQPISDPAKKKLKRAEIHADVMYFAGAGLVTLGVSLRNIPAGLVTLGAFLLLMPLLQLASSTIKGLRVGRGR